MYLYDEEDYKVHRNWFKPITVYKLLHREDKFKSLSPFQGYTFNHYEQYWAKLESLKTIQKHRVKREEDFEEFFDLGFVYKGFHSFLSIEDAKNYRRERPWPCAYGNSYPMVHECIIPPFSKYYLGWESPHNKTRQHIVSNRIIINGVII